MKDNPSLETQLLEAATADIKVLNSLLAVPAIKTISSKIYKKAIHMAMEAAQKNAQYKSNVNALLTAFPLPEDTLKEMATAIKGAAIGTELAGSMQSKENNNKNPLPARNPNPRSR